MDEVIISAADQQRIDDMVRQYRNQITNLYRIAYLQGAIDEAAEAREKMREVAA